MADYLGTIARIQNHRVITTFRSVKMPIAPQACPFGLSLSKAGRAAGV